MHGRTTLIISHRLSTISLADQVVLVDEGRVAATGTHADLVRNSHRYREVLGQLEAIAS
jgi:ATP-binding cassette subfamily B protein